MPKNRNPAVNKIPCTLMLLSLILVAATAAALIGCRESPNITDTVRIGLITTYMDTTYWRSAYKGALDRAGQLGGIEVTHLGTNIQPATDEQIRLIEHCVEEGYDGILLAASDRTALIEPIRRAKDAGMPIVMIDTGVSEPVYDALYSTDNKHAGAECARLMAHLIGGEGEIAIVSFSGFAKAALDREEGFVDEVAKNWPDIRIVGVEYCNFDTNEAKRQTEGFIREFPSIRGIWGTNPVAARGVIEGVSSQGKEDAIAVISFDNHSDLVQLLESGKLKATVIQNPSLMGAEGTQAIADILAGNPPPTQDNSIEVTVVSQENVNDISIQAILRQEY